MVHGHSKKKSHEPETLSILQNPLGPPPWWVLLLQMQESGVFPSSCFGDHRVRPAPQEQIFSFAPNIRLRQPLLLQPLPSIFYLSYGIVLYKKSHNHAIQADNLAAKPDKSFL